MTMTLLSYAIHNILVKAIKAAAVLILHSLNNMVDTQSNYWTTGTCTEVNVEVQAL